MAKCPIHKTELKPFLKKGLGFFCPVYLCTYREKIKKVVNNV